MRAPSAPFRLRERWKRASIQVNHWLFNFWHSPSAWGDSHTKHVDERDGNVEPRTSVRTSRDQAERVRSRQLGTPCSPQGVTPSRL